MKINVFYQAEGLADIAVIEVEDGLTFGEVRKLLAQAADLSDDAVLFVEDDEEPAKLDQKLAVTDKSAGIKLHLHRCRKVRVTVTFNGRVVQHPFTPATTVAKVKKWAAIKEFNMTPEEAGEHVLQISGTYDRPAPNTHIGKLVKHPECQIAFDLLPDERVNGALDQQD